MIVICLNIISILSVLPNIDINQYHRKTYTCSKANINRYLELINFNTVSIMTVGLSGLSPFYYLIDCLFYLSLLPSLLLWKLSVILLWLLTYQSIFYFIVHIMIISILYNLVFKLSCMRSNIWLDHMYHIILKLYLLMLLHPLYYYDFLLLHLLTFFLEYI